MNLKFWKKKINLPLIPTNSYAINDYYEYWKKHGESLMLLCCKSLAIKDSYANGFDDGMKYVLKNPNKKYNFKEGNKLTVNPDWN